MNKWTSQTSIEWSQAVEFNHPQMLYELLKQGITSAANEAFGISKIHRNTKPCKIPRSILKEQVCML